MEGERDKTEFTGFPIPAAAGLIASITFFMLWWFGERNTTSAVGNGCFRR